MDKSPDAFRTISEVADFLETPAHVLRFWESRFPQIKPVKRAGGRRYYRPSDVALLAGIRRLLHDEGMTIRGVQKVLREQGVRHVSGLSEEEADQQVWGEEDEDAEIASSEPIPLFGKDTKGATERAAIAPKAMQPDDARLPVEDAPEMRAVPKQTDVGVDDPADGPFDPSVSVATPEDIPFAREPVTSAPVEGPFDDTPEEPVAAEALDTAVEATLPPVDPFEEPVEMVEADGEELPLATTSDAPEPAVAPNAEPKNHAPPRWVAAELRDMRRGALYARRNEVKAMVSRFSALRERMAELARTPRR